MNTKTHCLTILSLLMIFQFASAEKIDLSTAILKAKDHISINHSNSRITTKDINDALVKDSYQNKHNAVSHVYFKQSINGIELHNGIYQVNVAKDGSIISSHNQFVDDLEKNINTLIPTISADQAILNAANSLGVQNHSTITMISQFNDRKQSAIYNKGNISLESIPVKLVYALNSENKPRLAWDLEIQQANAWWNIRVDAENGKIIGKDNWTVNEDYRVFPIPYESPNANNATHELVSNVADVLASPFGWHDTDGLVGAEFTVTRGNNVSAQDDLNANNSGGFRPDGGVDLNFDFTFDPTLEPNEGENLEASIVNLFYWNNIIHDVMYRYGFDEQSGNFQENNYGNGGSGSDSVNADAQDGSGTSNANFSTPPDGGNPRMQMYNFDAPANSTVLTVNSPPAVAGDYPISSASFGASIGITGISGTIEEVNDDTATPSTSDACEPLVGFTPGNIALLDRGDCQFDLKVLHAQQAGAIAAIVVNHEGDALTTMSGGEDGGPVTIAAVFIGQSNGDTIKAELGNSIDVTLAKSTPDRDGDLDNGIIIHEYGHGISNRLTGGPSAAGCLGNDEQMGEGWSDYFTLVMTTQSGAVSTDLRPMGTYAANNTGGIRQYPYTTDMSVNLHTFANVGNVSVPHGVGSIWAEMLWEVYWNLVDKHGYDADLYNGTGGNNMALQLVIDGLKLQACSPGFVIGRDAILSADMINNAGANQCEIWEGFAKRGLGINASSGNRSSVGDETEDFNIPVECREDLIFANNFEVAP